MTTSTNARRAGAAIFLAGAIAVALNFAARDTAAAPSAPATMRIKATVRTDSADVVAAIARFHAALAAGDSSAALALLADDVAILETGGVETKTQYRTGHINGDMSFAKAVPSVRTMTGVHVRGDAAWVTSSSVTQGESNGRQINSVGAELVVLSKEGGTWKIRAVHWSSRARRA